MYNPSGLPSLDPDQADHWPGSGFFGAFDSGSVEVNKGTLSQFEALGFKMPSAAEALADGWGISPESNIFDHRNQYSQPYGSAESIRRVDVQRCVNVAASQIVSTGVAFELVHWRAPAGSVVVLEQMPTMFDEITALDDAGVEVYSFGSLNGERLCLNQLRHPDPLVTEPLRWSFHVTFTDDPSRNVASVNPEMAYRGPVPPAEVDGQSITPPWTDARYGSQNRWAENQQFLAPSSVVVRYWVVLSGPVDRFDVRVGARLGGFYQQGGRRGAALDAVQVRRV
jgi:hypothetical protein